MCYYIITFTEHGRKEASFVSVCSFEWRSDFGASFYFAPNHSEQDAVRDSKTGKDCEENTDFTKSVSCDEKQKRGCCKQQPGEDKNRKQTGCKFLYHKPCSFLIL